MRVAGRGPGRVWRTRRAVSILAAACVSAAMLFVLASGTGAVPPLGPALAGGGGVWGSAAGGELPRSGTLDAPGLRHPVSVSFTAQGTASVRAASGHDAFLALGYLHARFRLAEMDLERRLGEGRLAQLAGRRDVASDEFELRLGLLRTARREWAATPRSSPAGQALLAYTEGVNDGIATARASGHWPAVFSLAGVYPAAWTPVDSLVIQGVLTQELDFTTAPLDYALLEKSLGPARTMAWFPVIAPNAQNPYDPGPYRYLGVTPIAPDAASTAAAVTGGQGAGGSGTAGQGAGYPRTSNRGAGSPEAAGHAAYATRAAAGGEARAGAGRAATRDAAAGQTTASTIRSAGSGGRTRRAGSAGTAGWGPRGLPRGAAEAAGALLAQVSRLPGMPADPGNAGGPFPPASTVHRQPDSNAWAANGPGVAGGGSMLAGDPHLPQTLPSIWYQVALSAPGLHVSGVSIPGVPGVLIGHNSRIAWSLTDTQNQATLFYAEKTSRARPGEYYWRGAWRRVRQVHYTIPVRGGPPVRLTVDLTVNGPVMTQAGQTVAVDWMGNEPSPDLAALLGVDEAGDFAQFRAALARWHAPSQNFVYADGRGNIGAISAGYYPQVPRGCQPWLPMPGTGSCDVTGTIPYAAVPQAYDPPGHVIATANQRPVSGSYPYYIGTSADFFDNSFRANEIYAYLRGHSGMTQAQFASLQTSVTDYLATQIVPRLLAALRATPGGAAGGAPLTGQERAAMRLLTGWDGAMTAGSAAASVWWTFWGSYLSAVFGPWWAAAKVPAGKDPQGLSLSSWPTSLTEDLAAWTLHDPSNPAFSFPGGPRRTAAQVMRTAFAAAVAHLSAELGGPPSSWSWGKLHSKRFPSVLGPAALGYGPRPAGGDQWTVNAAEGGLESSTGPSWRMIVLFTGSGAVTAEGVYPGGQSGNPASPWYADQIADWWDGRYLPMPPAGTPAAGTGGAGDTRGPMGPIRWTLRPDRHG
ncbi:MAG TPA: penicillin acylase family protein [Streptosporangiaceae bacterium]|nr:penicillin acylase family protein [Streptosporangiaceae bacterium]